MKKLFSTIAVVLFLTSILLSCKMDTAEIIPETDLIGNWKLIKKYNKDFEEDYRLGCKSGSIKIYANKEFIRNNISTCFGVVEYFESITFWEQGYKTLLLSQDGANKQQYNIIACNNHTLLLEDNTSKIRELYSRE